MAGTGYEPLDTLKPWGEKIWLIDGPAIRSYGFPFSTRATVVQLRNGNLWVHSPTRLTEGLRAELDALGEVRHLVAPNPFHFAYIAEWQAAWPKAKSWAAAGVVERAAKNGLSLSFDRELRSEEAEGPWAGQLDQRIVQGSTRFHEAVFFHHASRSLILTDLIEAIETAKLPVHCRPFAWINGIDDSDGKTPPLIRWLFRDKRAMADSVEEMIGWAPERIILAHGRCYDRNGVAELERAFRRILRDRMWDRELTRAKKRKAGKG
jgi:hypothetical protein